MIVTRSNSPFNKLMMMGNRGIFCSVANVVCWRAGQEGRVRRTQRAINRYELFASLNVNRDIWCFDLSFTMKCLLLSLACMSL